MRGDDRTKGAVRLVLTEAGDSALLLLERMTTHDGRSRYLGGPA